MTDREQLRERLAEAAYSSRWVGDWSDVGGIEREFELQVIDAILAEIASAGYVLMERGRVERLRVAAECYVEVWREECQGSGVPLDQCAYGNAGVEPGDLDPLEGGE